MISFRNSSLTCTIHIPAAVWEHTLKHTHTFPFSLLGNPHICVCAHPVGRFGILFLIHLQTHVHYTQSQVVWNPDVASYPECCWYRIRTTDSNPGDTTTIVLKRHQTQLPVAKNTQLPTHIKTRQKSWMPGKRMEIINPLFKAKYTCSGL